MASSTARSALAGLRSSWKIEMRTPVTRFTISTPNSAMPRIASIASRRSSGATAEITSAAALLRALGAALVQPEDHGDEIPAEHPCRRHGVEIDRARDAVVSDDLEARAAAGQRLQVERRVVQVEVAPAD